MSQLSHLIYVSSTSGLMSEPDLLELLTQAREKNQANGVTGILLYDDGNVMQALEGIREDVEKIFLSIKRDRRHRGLIVLLDENIEEREYSDWAMSYRNVSDPNVPGISQFMSIPEGENSEKNRSEIKLLLGSFKRQSAR